MRKLFIPIIIAASLALHAEEAFDTPYYPLGCFYEYSGQLHPITDVNKKQPIALVDGRKTEVPHKKIRFDRLELYADGFINVIKESGHTFNSTLRSVSSLNEGDAVLNKAFIDIEFAASRDVENCFVLVFSGSKSGMAARDLDELFINFTALGSIKAGEKYEKTLTAVTLNTVAIERDQNYFLVFYDSGMPLRSSFDSEVAKHFSKRKQTEFDYYLKQYIANNSNKSIKQQAFYSYIPYLPEELYQQAGPIDTKVTLRILANGRVTVEKLSNVKDAAANQFLRARIEEWLFFPKLENGTPTETLTATRIKF